MSKEISNSSLKARNKYRELILVIVLSVLLPLTML